MPGRKPFGSMLLWCAQIRLIYIYIYTHYLLLLAVFRLYSFIKLTWVKIESSSSMAWFKEQLQDPRTLPHVSCEHPWFPIYIYIDFSLNQSGWWFQPLSKIRVSWGYLFPTCGKKCSKPPTSNPLTQWYIPIFRGNLGGSPLGPLPADEGLINHQPLVECCW